MPTGYSDFPSSHVSCITMDFFFFKMNSEQIELPFPKCSGEGPQDSVPQDSVLGLNLFKAFVNGLDEK